MDTSEIAVEVDTALPLEAPVDLDWISGAVRAALTAAHKDPARPVGYEIANGRAVSVSVRITDDKEMHRLNREFRGVDRTTDVLSFAFLEGTDVPTTDMPSDWPVQLGELIISWPYAKRQALELGHTPAVEVAWLLIHGSLQLIGYHHDTDTRAEHMEAVEQRALVALGVNMG